MSLSLQNVSADLRTLLSGNTITVDSASVLMSIDINLFLFDPEMQAMKSEGVYIVNMAGDMPEAYLNGAVDAAFVKAKVRVTVIGGPGAPGFLRGEQVARKVQSFFQQCDLPSPYVQVLSKQAQPEYKGTTSDKRPKWEFDLQCDYSV